jgi:hypothetical protein
LTALLRFCAYVCAFTLLVSHALILVQCLFSMTHLPILPEGESRPDIGLAFFLNDPPFWPPCWCSPPPPPPPSSSRSLYGLTLPRHRDAM